MGVGIGMGMGMRLTVRDPKTSLSGCMVTNVRQFGALMDRLGWGRHASGTSIKTRRVTRPSRLSEV